MFTLYELSQFKKNVNNNKKNILIGAGVGVTALAGVGAALALRGKGLSKVGKKVAAQVDNVNESGLVNKKVNVKSFVRLTKKGKTIQVRASSRGVKVRPSMGLKSKPITTTPKTNNDYAPYLTMLQKDSKGRKFTLGIDDLDEGTARLVQPQKGKSRLVTPVHSNYVLEGQTATNRGTIHRKTKWRDVESGSSFETLDKVEPDMKKVKTTQGHSKGGRLKPSSDKEKYKIPSVVAGVKGDGGRLSTQKQEIASQLIGGKNSKAYQEGKGRVNAIASDDKAIEAYAQLQKQLTGLRGDADTIKAIRKEIKESGINPYSDEGRKILESRLPKLKDKKLSTQRGLITKAKQKLEAELVRLRSEGKYKQLLHNLVEFKRGRRKGSRNKVTNYKKVDQVRKVISTGKDVSREARGWIKTSKDLYKDIKKLGGIGNTLKSIKRGFLGRDR